jgi:hypothetical protein
MKINGLIRFNFLLLLLCASCGNDVIEKEIITPKIYFEMHYENDAWGMHREAGFVITGAGLVTKFDNPATWNSSDRTLTPQQVLDNLNQTTATSVTISSNELSAYTNLIPTITTSEFSKKVSGGNDRGIFLYYAYQLNPTTGNYDPILLEQDGDWKMSNKDESAIKIATWLKEVRDKIQ